MLFKRSLCEFVLLLELLVRLVVEVLLVVVEVVVVVLPVGVVPLLVPEFCAILVLKKAQATKVRHIVNIFFITLGFKD